MLYEKLPYRSLLYNVPSEVPAIVAVVLALVPPEKAASAVHILPVVSVYAAPPALMRSRVMKNVIVSGVPAVPVAPEPVYGVAVTVWLPRPSVHAAYFPPVSLASAYGGRLSVR